MMAPLIPATHARGREFKEVPEDTIPRTRMRPTPSRRNSCPASLESTTKSTARQQDIEAKINAQFLEKTKGMEDWEILQQNFDKMK